MKYASEFASGKLARGKRRLLLSALMVGLLVFAWVSVKPILERWHTSSKGEHLTHKEAGQVGVRLNFPPEGSDIRFYQHLLPDQVVIVDFAIEEKSFLRWADKEGWGPKRIVGSIMIMPRAKFGDNSTVVEVTDGYMNSTDQRGTPNTFTVVYDLKTQRAYYQFDSLPHNEN
jgi:hypothetical protein